MSAILFARSIGQALTLVVTISISTTLSCVTAIGAYYFVFQLPVGRWDQPLDLTPTHFMVIAFVMFPLALTVGIWGGSMLWARMFRTLRPDAPEPDRLTDIEAQKLYDSFVDAGDPHMVARRKRRLLLVGFIAAIAGGILVLARHYL